MEGADEVGLLGLELVPQPDTIEKAKKLVELAVREGPTSPLWFNPNTWREIAKGKWTHQCHHHEATIEFCDV